MWYLRPSNVSYLFLFQGIGGAKSNNGIQYKILVIYVNGERRMF